MGLENCCCLAYHLNGNEKVFRGGSRHKGNIWKQLSLWSGGAYRGGCRKGVAYVSCMANGVKNETEAETRSESVTRGVDVGGCC